MRPIITRGAKRRLPGDGRGSRRPELALAVVLFASAVALIAFSTSLVGAGADRSRAVAGATTAGGRIIPFRVRNLAGRMISVPARGRPGVLLFAASSCASCLPAARALSAVKAKLGSRIDALMVDVDAREAPSYLRGWASVVHPSYPLTIDKSGRLGYAYRITGLGTTIVYNARGRILARATDPTERQLEAALREAGVSA